MFDPQGVSRRSNRRFSHKGQVIQKRRVDRNYVIDPYQISIYKQFFLNNPQFGLIPDSSQPSTLSFNLSGFLLSGSAVSLDRFTVLEQDTTIPAGVHNYFAYRIDNGSQLNIVYSRAYQQVYTLPAGFAYIEDFLESNYSISVLVTDSDQKVYTLYSTIFPAIETYTNFMLSLISPPDL